MKQQPIIDLVELNSIAPVTRFILENFTVKLSLIIFRTTNVEALSEFIDDFCNTNELGIITSITSPAGSEEYHFYELEIG